MDPNVDPQLRNQPGVLGGCFAQSERYPLLCMGHPLVKQEVVHVILGSHSLASCERKAQHVLILKPNPQPCAQPLNHIEVAS